MRFKAKSLRKITQAIRVQQCVLIFLPHGEVGSQSVQVNGRLNRRAGLIGMLSQKSRDQPRQ